MGYNVATRACDVTDYAQVQALGQASLSEYAAMISRIPMGRAGLAEDTANAVAFLCSEGAGYITAGSVNVLGGEEPH